MPGVLGVFFADDLGLAGAPIPSLTTPDPDFTAATSLVLAEQRLPILATDRVHYVGHPIAVVVADDRYRAEDAAENVELSYEPLPALTDAEAALDPAAPGALRATSLAMRPPGWTTRSAIPTRAFAAAHRVVEGTYQMNRHGAVPLECRVCWPISTDGGNASKSSPPPRFRTWCATRSAG